MRIHKFYCQKYALLLALTSGLYFTNGCSSYTEVDLQPGPGIPPDPGRKTANATLLGVDSDNDGVRDDVQRYILAQKFDHPFFKRALMQYARTIQIALKEADQPELAEKNLHVTSYGMGCALTAVVDNLDTYDFIDELDKVFYNTTLRRQTHLKWVRNIPSTWQYSPNTAQEMCNFGVDDFNVDAYEGERWK